MPRRALLVAFAIVAVAALPGRVRAETRVALVIGNGTYPSGPLGSPKDDAKAIEAKLKKLGFEVTRKTDLDREQLFGAIRAFGDRLQQGDTVALFYYSGHGMQINNHNYMIPIDADIRTDLDVAHYAVPLEDVLARINHGKSNPNIVILDACRNNPFEKRYKSTSDGLARVDAPPSTLTVFAAAPGQVASAASGGSLSSFTASLVEHIDKPYPSAISMFQAVQNDVYKRSGREQKPYLDLSPGVPNDFSLKSVIAALPPVPPAPPPATPPPVKLPEQKPAVAQTKPVAPGSGQSFKDCDVCPEMVVVPAGTFLMGSPDSDPDANVNEKPQHRVTIAKPFAIGKYEVTFAEWDACADAGGCNGYRPSDRGWGRKARPVLCSWQSAQGYVTYLSQETGEGYRLPTEAEWEYAARAGTSTRFSFGDNITANEANFSASNLKKTVAVGSYPPNSWGLHDMHGNVREWVEDCYRDKIEKTTEDGRAWKEDRCLWHVLRGGSWNCPPKCLRSAARDRLGDIYDARLVGFRVARTLD